MIETRNTRQPIVTDATFNAAQEVIQTVRQTTTYPFLLDAKLGDANNGPMPDTKIASTYNTALNSIRDKFTRIINALAQTDQKHGTPLAQIAQRANDIMASAAIVNRHKRRPPLYAESTLNTFVKLGFAAQEHFPLMRAAGYVTPPTITPPSHDVDFIIADIAAHVARSHEPQSPDQILESMGDRQGDLANWPQLDLPLFIRRVAGIHPDDRGLYHPRPALGQLSQRSTAGRQHDATHLRPRPATPYHGVPNQRNRTPRRPLSAQRVQHHQRRPQLRLHVRRSFLARPIEVRAQGMGDRPRCTEHR